MALCAMCEWEDATTTYGLPVCQKCYDNLIHLEGRLKEMEIEDPNLAELGRRVEEGCRKIVEDHG